MKKYLTVVLLLSCFSLSAAPAWYSGKLTRIWVYGNNSELIVMVDSDAFDSCKHKYLYFRRSSWTDYPKKMDATLSLLLSAYHTNSLVRFLIDKPADGEHCDAMSADIFKG